MTLVLCELEARESALTFKFRPALVNQQRRHLTTRNCVSTSGSKRHLHRLRQGSRHLRPSRTNSRRKVHPSLSKCAIHCHTALGFRNCIFCLLKLSGGLQTWAPPSCATATSRPKRAVLA